jgi:hypothetical protein
MNDRTTARLSAPKSRRRVVDRFVETVSPGDTLGCELLQIQTGRLGSDHQRQRGTRTVRSDRRPVSLNPSPGRRMRGTGS